MNDPGPFEVVFNGEIAGKKSLHDVKEQMGAMFQLDPVKLEALFSGRPVVVKKNLSREMADKYKLAIGKAGGISVVAEMNAPRPEIPLPDATDVKDDFHSYLITANKFTCPACGHEQLLAEKCNSCYINIDEYKEQERLAKKQQKMQRWLADKEVKAEEQAAVAAVAQTLTEQPAQPDIDSKKTSLLLPVTGLAVVAVGALAAAFYSGWIQL